MNLQAIQAQVLGGKWAINRTAFYSLYKTLNSLDSISYGGIKGFLFGNPIRMKALDNNTQSATINNEVGDIAVVNISGILMKGVDEDEEQLLGMINIDRIAEQLDILATDPTVASIVLNFASPGGGTTGIDVLGRKIKHIDQNIKPVYAWTEYQMSSAAYWLGSQARAIGMTPSADIGAIGVYMILTDESAKLEKEGIKVNAIASGKYKLMGHDHKPLLEDERAILQEQVSSEHQAFKNIILSNRPDVKEEALEGLDYSGKQAFDLGLTDVVCDTLTEFVQILNEAI